MIVPTKRVAGVTRADVSESWRGSAHGPKDLNWSHLEFVWSRNRRQGTARGTAPSGEGKASRRRGQIVCCDVEMQGKR